MSQTAACFDNSIVIGKKDKKTIKLFSFRVLNEKETFSMKPHPAAPPEGAKLQAQSSDESYKQGVLFTPFESACHLDLFHIIQ